MNRETCDSDFLRGYIDTALFCANEYPTPGQDAVKRGRVPALWPALPGYFIEQATADCAAFREAHAALLARTGDDWQNGSDFWYTRNGHGIGYWDRRYPDDVAHPLAAAAHACGSHELLPDEIGQAVSL